MLIDDDLTNPKEACPNCEHLITLHSKESGCHDGWGPYVDGIAQNTGCSCPMTLAEQYNPTREKDIPNG